MPAKFELSIKTIIFITFYLLLLYLVYQILDILLLLLVAFIIMSGLRPGVDRLEKLKIPRVFAVLIVYIIMILILIFIGSVVIPPLVFESTKLISQIPNYLEKNLALLNPVFGTNLSFLSNQISPVSTNIVKFTLGIFTNIVTVITIMVITFYLLIERKNLFALLESVTEEKTAKKAFDIVLKVEERLGGWIRGQLFLDLVIGVMTLIGLLFLGVPFALPLAIFAGFLEMIPNIGPIISAVPAVLVALSVSPLLALATVILYFLVQQLENHLIVPNVMKKVVGINPLVAILVLLIGGKLLGVLGIILAVPVFLIFQTTFREIVGKK